MKHAPVEFESLLSRKGLGVLAGQRRHPRLCDGKSRFLHFKGLIDPRQARALLLLLEKHLRPVLKPLAQPIPRETVTALRFNYREQLPKTVRTHSAMLDAPNAKAYSVAKDLGLLTLLRSASFHQLASALSGYPLLRRNGLQALCYQPGDYAGPHNDAHPEDVEAAHGYTDMHLTLSTPWVKQQLLVYEKNGHFTEVVDVTPSGLLTCYRLPFWHYTTPLVAKAGKAASSRRWLLLGTFLDDMKVLEGAGVNGG